VFGVAGFGLGLLIASALSFFFWWWAVGAALFLALHIPVLVAARGRQTWSLPPKGGSHERM
jgi:hypothetical protein